MKIYNYFLISALFLSLNLSVFNMGNSQVNSATEQEHSNKDVRIFLKNFFEEDSQIHLLSKFDGVLNGYNFDESSVAEKKIWIAIFKDLFFNNAYFSVHRKELKNFLERLKKKKGSPCFIFVRSVVKEVLKVNLEFNIGHSIL